jgi:tetratricopeptide (TPR) repeat protein
LAYAKKFVNDFPELPSGYLFVGTTLDHLGMAHLDRKEIDEADKRFEELEQYYLLAVNVNLGEDTRLSGIAKAKLRRGDIAYDRGKLQQAFDLYKAAEGMCRKLAGDFPMMSQHRINLAYSLFWQGFLLKVADRDGCLKKMDEAIQLMEVLVKADPTQASTLETYRNARKELTP